MARKMTEWPSKRGPITKIMPSDGCIGDTVPLAVGKWYDFHEFGWYMGNVGQGMEGDARAGAGGTLVQAGSRRGSGTGTAGEGGAWRSAPGQRQCLPLASKHHRRRQGTALTVDLWI